VSHFQAPDDGAQAWLDTVPRLPKKIPRQKKIPPSPAPAAILILVFCGRATMRRKGNDAIPSKGCDHDPENREAAATIQGNIIVNQIS
jgi:hypothetical protein